ncbi:MAG: ATP-binding protein [Methanobrevibacter sp.]|jgi:predicted ATPase|nr:ATP-binding protein [Candidatus Methanoflexus mossambicus]
MKDVTFEISDFGPINNAKINLSKINVVCGINGSGKTTLSKIIYSILATYTDVGDLILKEMIHMFAKYIKDEISKYKDEAEVNNVYNKLNELNNEFIYLNNYKNLKEDIKYDIIDLALFFKDSDKIHSNKLFIGLFELLVLIDSLYDDNLKNSEIIAQFFNNIFGDDLYLINKWNKNANIKAYTNDKSFSANLSFPLKDYPLNVKRIMDKLDNKEYHSQLSVNGKFYINEIFYIETPFLLDFFKHINPLYDDIKGLKLLNTNDDNNFCFHQSSLILKLMSENISSKYSQNNNNSEILKLFDNVLNGSIEFNPENNKFFYSEKNNDYSMSSTASGMKSIGVLKALIKKNLDSNSLIIIDEPEIHLHPEWQIKLVELIVILSKEHDFNFYINSHSPQFVEAFEVLSEKYGMGNDINFYLSEEHEDSNKFEFKKIDRENLRFIYRNLGRPYRKINEIRGENLNKKT